MMSMVEDVKNLDERANEFAKKALDKLKSGNAKKERMGNEGVKFSVERDRSIVKKHKELIDSDMWQSIVSIN